MDLGERTSHGQAVFVRVRKGTMGHVLENEEVLAGFQNRWNDE